MTMKRLTRFPFWRALTSLCAVAVLCTGCAYSGVNGSFIKTVDYQARTHSKDDVMVLLANTAPVASHYHVGEVRVSRGTMDSDAALYDAMRDLGVKYGFDGVNDIYCGENYSLTEPYLCTGAAFVFNAPAPQPQAAPAAPVTLTESKRFYADENKDFGVAAHRSLETNVGTPTPVALPSDIGKTISTEQLDELMIKHNPLLIDVLNGNHDYTIRNAFYLPEGGQPGNFADANQKSFEEALAILAVGQTDKPIVFFCLGARCWESYNAVLRARSAGYTNLFWYRGGLQAWMEAGYPIIPLDEAEF
jgi:PQQ-dependent catabolism-associated CXXCW motif protein